MSQTPLALLKNNPNGIIFSEILRFPIFRNRFPCELNVTPAALIVAEDRSDLSLRDFKHTSARCAAYISEASAYRIFVKRTFVGHVFRPRLAVIYDAGAAQIFANQVVVKDVYWEIVGNKAMTEFKFREEFIGGMGNTGTTLGTAV